MTLLVALAAPVFAQHTDQPPGDPFRKGETEYGLLAGIDSAMDIWAGLPESNFFSLGLRLSHVVTGPIFAGPCRGNLVLSAELNPLVIFHDDYGSTYAFSATPIIRYYFTPGARVRPFITAGVGVVLSAEPIPHDISRVNFTPQGGGGLAVTLRQGTVFSMEYRLHHMSDGILTTYNPGVNSNEFLVGISWTR
jgi:hypothetical protein